MHIKKKITIKKEKMVRKSPMEHAKLFKFKVKQGLDGNMWTSQPDINNVFKWKRSKASTMTKNKKKQTTKKTVAKRATNKKSTIKKTKTNTPIQNDEPDITLHFECLLRENGHGRFGSINLRMNEARIKIRDIVQLQLESIANNDIIKQSTISFTFTDAFIEFVFFPLTSISKIKTLIQEFVNSLQDGAEDGYLGGDDEVHILDEEIVFDMFESRGKWNKKWSRYYTS